MKKLLAIIISTIALCGCVGGKSNSGKTGQSGDITALSSVAMEATNVTAIDEGVYYTDGGLLHFYDVNTGESVPVCNRAECTHSDETCTAYMPDVGTLLFTNRKGYIFFTDNSDIYKINYDGSERSKVYTRADGVFPYRQYLSDDENLYFIEGIVSKDGVMTHELVAVNINSGNRTTLYSSNEYLVIVSSYDDNIVMTVGGGYADSSRIISFSMKDGSVTELQPDGSWPFVIGDKLYTMSEDCKTMYCRDIATGEKTTVVENIPLDKQPRSCFPEYNFGDYILLHTSGVGEYIVNTANGSATKLKLHITAQYMETVPKDYVDPTLISILNRVGDNLVVYIGDKEIPYYDVGPSGNTEEFYDMNGVFALISIQDFLNNNANYTVINAT